MIETSLQQILLLCESVPDQVRSITRVELSEEHSEGTWSKKEILGHLCDSAFVNLQRLVRGQVESKPQIFYDQNRWVNVQEYENYDVEDLIRLWHSLNKHFYHIAYSMNENALNSVCLDKEGNKSTLQFLIDDYVSHLQHHIEQIIGLPIQRLSNLTMTITIKETRNINQEDVIQIYHANHWSSAQKPDKLFKALLSSHSLVTAWDGERLIGLGNALSDGYLVVYYPHLIVHPEYQGMGVGKLILDKFKEKYGTFHQQILVADGKAIDFYEKCGFERAGETKSMWIYQGKEH